MKVGIISSSRVNLYASTLMSKLVAQGDDVDCIVCVEKPKLTLLRNYVKRVGVRRAAGKVLDYFSIKESKSNVVRQRLREYAAQQGLDGWARPVDALCRTLDIVYRSVRSINHASTIEFIKSRNLDLLINAGGEIIRAPVIESVSRGVLNAHMGYLPMFRGYNVLEWSLFYRKPVGVTLHFIDTGIDTGDIISFSEIPVEEIDTIESLRAKSFPVSVALMARYVPLFKNDSVRRERQRLEDGKQYFAMHPRLGAAAEMHITELARASRR